MPKARLSFLLLAGVVVVASCTQKEHVSSSESTAISSTASSATVPATTSSSVSTTAVESSSTTALSVPTATTATIAAVASTAAATETGLGSTEGEQSGVTAMVKELKRASGGTVTLKFTIVNNSDKSVGFGYNFADPSHDVADHGGVGGVQLIDAVGKKKYFVARDSENRAICSQKVADIAPGKSANLWAKFPAPPDDVQKISVVIPHFAPLEDVPISR